LLDAQAEIVELKQERSILNEKLEQYKVNNTSIGLTITKSNDVATNGTEEIRRLLAQTNLKDQEI